MEGRREDVLPSRYPFTPFGIFRYCVASLLIQKINSLLRSNGSENGLGDVSSPENVVGLQKGRCLIEQWPRAPSLWGSPSGTEVRVGGGLGRGWWLQEGFQFSPEPDRCSCPCVRAHTFPFVPGWGQGRGALFSPSWALRFSCSRTWSFPRPASSPPWSWSSLAGVPECERREI